MFTLQTFESSSNDKKTFELSKDDEILITKILNEKGYRLVRECGKGGFSAVFIVESVKYQHEFVVKVSYVIPGNDHEARILNNLAHTNIISMYKFFEESGFLFVIFEYCVNGSLNEMIEKNGAIQDELLYTYCAQLLSSLKYCHTRNIAHRDIKPSNILIDSHGRLKLADFGLAMVCQKGTKLKGLAGSRPFMAPEVISKKEYDPFAADIWSLGITFYVMAYGSLPWQPNNVMLLERQIENGMVSFNFNVAYESEVRMQFLLVLRKMLEVKPQRRATLDWILNQPIFKNCIGAFDNSKLGSSKIMMKKSVDSLSQNKGKRSSRPYGISNVLSFRSVVDVKKSKKFSSPFPTFLTS